MFGSKIKLDENLLARCKERAETLGYSSVEEFISHVLERELKGGQGRSEADRERDEEEISKRLKGLGYIE